MGRLDVGKLGEKGNSRLEDTLKNSLWGESFSYRRVFQTYGGEMQKNFAIMKQKQKYKSCFFLQSFVLESC